MTYTGQAGTWIGNSNYGKYLDELETVQTSGELGSGQLTISLFGQKAYYGVRSAAGAHDDGNDQF